ncbi:hypothetical protein ALP77_101826 [Pseudomonas amygdali pv. tabaci]|uniref:Uncharacterized protein n=1 Tax=Pseudomonas amygdali pv. lachrymans TaxID=53707 RepID=A0A0N8RZ54_PSEAV|nr:hypothetical protein ALO35_102491 [Pseudomonas amygdali pv. lachrymans]KPY78835.1 hypothetical protein ALO60_101949 [Pseudomonas amygdali pv. tabaci]RMR84067.1 hypothetical protein ALP77_101826 [Pseudomonas amygdali pv. tabaci]
MSERGRGVCRVLFLCALNSFCLCGLVISQRIMPFIGIERPMVIAKYYLRQIIEMLPQRGQPEML